jgi:hypothetical protein
VKPVNVISAFGDELEPEKSKNHEGSEDELRIGEEHGTFRLSATIKRLVWNVVRATWTIYIRRT